MIPRFERYCVYLMLATPAVVIACLTALAVFRPDLIL